MNDDISGFGGFCAFCVFFGVMLCGIVYPIMHHVENYEIRARAIEMDKAYYDSKTGEFTWSDNVLEYIIDGEGED